MMKKIIFFAIIMASVYSSRSQEDCSLPDNFGAATLYVQPGAIGFEMGIWPVDIPFGGFIGGAYVYNNSFYDHGLKFDQGQEISMDLYIRPAFRVNRFVYITTTIGIVDVQDWYISAGARLVAPVRRGNRLAVILEPQFGTRGWNVLGGLTVALY